MQDQNVIVFLPAPEFNLPLPSPLSTRFLWLGGCPWAGMQVHLWAYNASFWVPGASFPRFWSILLECPGILSCWPPYFSNLEPGPLSARLAATTPLAGLPQLSPSQAPSECVTDRSNTRRSTWCVYSLYVQTNWNIQKCIKGHEGITTLCSPPLNPYRGPRTGAFSKGRICPYWFSCSGNVVPCLIQRSVVLDGWCTGIFFTYSFQLRHPALIK